jgi:hypothetical protein
MKKKFAGSSGFSGVNRKCRVCKRDCKQWEQVKVICCPKFDMVKCLPNENSV